MEIQALGKTFEIVNTLTDKSNSFQILGQEHVVISKPVFEFYTSLATRDETLFRTRKLQSIKNCRETHGSGLYECKLAHDLVEALLNRGDLSKYLSNKIGEISKSSIIQFGSMVTVDDEPFKYLVVGVESQDGYVNPYKVIIQDGNFAWWCEGDRIKLA